MKSSICKRCRASFGKPWRSIDDWQWVHNRVLCPHPEEDDEGQIALQGRYICETPPPDCYYAVEHVVGLELAETP